MHECSYLIGGHGCVEYCYQREVSTPNVVDSVAQDKPKTDWSNDDKKKVQYY